MEIVCPTCQRLFQHARDERGDDVVCPHCGAHATLAEDLGEYHPLGWRTFFDNTVSGMGSLVFHLTIVLILGLIEFGGPGVAGDGDGVLIGQAPGPALSDAASSGEFTADSAVESAAPSDAMEMEVELAPVEATSTDSGFDVSASAASVASSVGGFGGVGGFNSGGGGSAQGGGGAGGDGSWNGMIGQLRRDGLDIVIVFDSTSSMGGEIDEVKRQIERIGDALIRLIPKTRIGICTYRDSSDDYQAKGLPLTGDIDEVRKYLSAIGANGGGDIPEAVQEGLRWTVDNNDFRQGSRKVILLFGDAPPHDVDLDACISTASDFHIRQKGIVSTVTCRKEEPLEEFSAIAQAGGGEAFLTSDERQIMTQLMILVFGSRHRDKVLESFEFLGR